MSELVRQSINDGIKDIPKNYVYTGRGSALKDYGILFLGGFGIGYVLQEFIPFKEVESQFMDSMNWGILPLAGVSTVSLSRNLSNDTLGSLAGVVIGTGYFLGRGLSVFS